MMLTCLLCNHAHTIQEWNKSTIAFYNEEVVLLEEAIETKNEAALYICPTCQFANTTETLDFVTDENEAYAEHVLRKD